MKNLLGIFAVVVAIGLSAFTAKKSVQNNLAILDWYQVTYDAQHPNGYIPDASAFYVTDEKANVSSPCDLGTVKDCLRGFSSTPAFPTGLPGSDQIKKP